MKKNLLIYMPAFNEAISIGGVIGSIKSLPLSNSYNCELLVVDDCSSDDTAQISESKGAIVIRHKYNKGVGAAFHTALDYALKNNFYYLVSIDADGQFNVNEISTLLDSLVSNELDMVSGNRFAEGRPKNMSKIKFWGNKKMSNLISYLTGYKLRDVSCGFRAYNREALLHLNLFGTFTYTQETILDLAFKGLSIQNVPVTVQYFHNRKSRVVKSIGNYAINSALIIARTFRDYYPLKLFGTIGIASILLGIFLGSSLFIYFLLSGSFSPYKFIGFIGLGLVIVGLLTLVLGIIADMIKNVKLNQERLLYMNKKDRFNN